MSSKYVERWDGNGGGQSFEINLDLYMNKYLFLYILHNIDNETIEINRMNESFVSF